MYHGRSREKRRVKRKRWTHWDEIFGWKWSEMEVLNWNWFFCFWELHLRISGSFYSCWSSWKSGKHEESNTKHLPWQMVQRSTVLASFAWLRTTGWNEIRQRLSYNHKLSDMSHFSKKLYTVISLLLQFLIF